MNVRYLNTIFKCMRLSKRSFCSKANNDTSLLKYLQAKIKFSGPITVHEYMKEVLTNPLSGYYTKKDVIGEEGDFVTSPEVSQIFGELLGIWIYNEWEKMGSPRPFKLVEFGPGTGSLLQDILRTLKQLKLGKDDIELHLIEKSLSMSFFQEKTLCPNLSSTGEQVPSELSATYKSNVTSDGIPVHWHYHFSDVPPGFSMIYAHEFFDALPIHKLRRTEDGWREVLVDLCSPDESQSGLRYVISRESTPAAKLYVNENEKKDEVEVSPETGVLVKELSSRIEENGGAALIVDYGHDGTQGDTFRAFKQHTQVSPLDNPGHSDLTADVDFSFIRKYAEENLLTFGPVSQADFLREMGIGIRLKNLLESAGSQGERERLVRGVSMMMDSNQMGSRFKVMALLPKVMEPVLKKCPPVGFVSCK